MDAPDVLSELEVMLQENLIYEYIADAPEETDFTLHVTHHSGDPVGVELCVMLCHENDQVFAPPAAEVPEIGVVPCTENDLMDKVVIKEDELDEICVAISRSENPNLAKFIRKVDCFHPLASQAEEVPEEEEEEGEAGVRIEDSEVQDVLVTGGDDLLERWPSECFLRLGNEAISNGTGNFSFRTPKLTEANSLIVIRFRVGCSRALQAVTRRDFDAFRILSAERNTIVSIQLSSEEGNEDLLDSPRIARGNFENNPFVLESDDLRVAGYLEAELGSGDYAGITTAGYQELDDCPEALVAAYVGRIKWKGHVGMLFVLECLNGERRIYLVHSYGKGASGRLFSLPGQSWVDLYYRNNISISRITSQRFLSSWICSRARWSNRWVHLKELFDVSHKTGSKAYHDPFVRKNCRNLTFLLACEWLRKFQGCTDWVAKDASDWLQEIWASRGGATEKIKEALTDYYRQQGWQVGRRLRAHVNWQTGLRGVLGALGEATHLVFGSNLGRRPVVLGLESSDAEKEEFEHQRRVIRDREARARTARDASRRIAELRHLAVVSGSGWRARHTPGVAYSLDASDHTFSGRRHLLPTSLGSERGIRRW